MCPGLRADLEGRKCSCEFLPTVEFHGRAHLQPSAGTYLQPLPIHCGGVELEALGVLGAGAGGGVALRASAVGLPVLWGTKRGCPHCPRGSASSQGKQVGLAMPCWAPVTGSEDGGHLLGQGRHLPGQLGRCRMGARCGPAVGPHHTLASRGRHTCCGAGAGQEGVLNRGHLPSPGQQPRAGPADTVAVPQPCVLTVTWHQTQCRPVMPW